MKSKISNVVRIAAAMACAGGAGVANAMDTSFAMQAGYDFGGEELVSVRFTDGSSSSIDANDGLFFGGGVSMVSDDKSLEGQITVNFKYQSIDASNGSVSWSRWPLEALFFYRTENIRVGGGLTYHMNPKLSGSGVVGGLDVELDDSMGQVLQFEYRFNESVSLGLRYTRLEYDYQGDSAIKSNGAGIVVSGRF